MQVDMKLCLALFLCGVVYATASSICSEKELDQCGFSPSGDVDYKETEAFLNDVCRSQGCLTNYKRRCGTTGLQPYQQLMVKQAEKIYNVMCGKKNKPMRQKYLDSAKCINRVAKEFNISCKTQPGFEIHDPNFCPITKEYLSCIVGLLSRECGSDAGEVYEAVAPDLELYGC